MATIVPESVAHERLTVVGIDVTTRNAMEFDPATARLPSLWHRFYQEDVLARVLRKKAPVFPVGLYTDYESDDTGPYRVVAGAAVEEGTPVPEGLASACLPAGQYLIFRGEGPIPAVVVETWKAVWDYFAKPGPQVRAYTADLERYRGPNAVDIYISVK